MTSTKIVKKMAIPASQWRSVEDLVGELFMRGKNSPMTSLASDRWQGTKLVAQQVHPSRDKQLHYHLVTGLLAVGKCDERLSAGAYISMMLDRRKIPTTTNKCGWHNRQSDRRYIKKQETLAFPALAGRTCRIFATHPEVVPLLTGYEP